MTLLATSVQSACKDFFGTRRAEKSKKAKAQKLSRDADIRLLTSPLS
jgi:hypothetical protein